MFNKDQRATYNAVVENKRLGYALAIVKSLFIPERVCTSTQKGNYLCQRQARPKARLSSPEHLRGIGAVYADRLAKRGYDLILVARNAQLLSKVAGTLYEKTGRQVATIAADLTKAEDLCQIEDALKMNSDISILVDNAGFGRAKPVIDSSVEEMENMIELNITALTRLTLAVLPAFLERGVVASSTSLPSSL